MFFIVTCELSLCRQRLYREKGENEMHKYTMIGDIPEHVQAKLNAMNLSEVRIHFTASVSTPKSIELIHK